MPVGMFGYATDLRSKTQGRAAFTMNFLNYNAVSENLVRELLKKLLIESNIEQSNQPFFT